MRKGNRRRKEVSTTREDVLLALEQQRQKATKVGNSSQTDTPRSCSSSPRFIPGYFFDVSKNRYFPLSMRRDTVIVGRKCLGVIIG